MTIIDHAAIVAVLQDGVHYTTRWTVLTDAIRKYLDAHPTYEMSTTELCEALLPRFGAGGHGQGILAAARLPKALCKLADTGRGNLATKATSPDAVVRRYGRDNVPWIWRAPSGDSAEAQPIRPRQTAPILASRHTTVRLTSAGTLSPCRVRLTYIAAYWPDNRGTLLSLTNGLTMHVTEPLAEIDSLLISLGHLAPQAEPDDEARTLLNDGADI